MSKEISLVKQTILNKLRATHGNKMISTECAGRIRVGNLRRAVQSNSSLGRKYTNEIKRKLRDHIESAPLF